MEYCHRERDLGPQTLVILSEVRVLEPSLCSDRESRVLFIPARQVTSGQLYEKAYEALEEASGYAVNGSEPAQRSTIKQSMQ